MTVKVRSASQICFACLRAGDGVFASITTEWRNRRTAASALLVSAVLAFVIGTGVYFLDRSWSSVLFLAPLADWQPGSIGLFGQFGNSLPSLAHAYAFALLVIVALGPWRWARPAGALSWLLVACGLECLQSPAFRATFAPVYSVSANLADGGPFFDFMMNGRFDAVDLAATVAGVLAAYAVSSVLETQQ